MRQSEKINTLLESLVKVQAELPTLPKDKNGYGYKYTDLDTVITTIKPILSKYNIGFMQMLSTLENGKSAITTRLFNASGEWVEDTTPLPEVSMAKTNAAQNLGAAITYMKRYSLCSMLGISSDEDQNMEKKLFLICCLAISFICNNLFSLNSFISGSTSICSSSSSSTLSFSLLVSSFSIFH